MKRILTFIAFVFVVIGLRAECVGVQSFEAELDLGGTYPLLRNYGYSRQIGYDFELAVRYNLSSLPVSVGVMTGVYETKWNDKLHTNGWDHSFAETVFLAGVTGEYDFRRGGEFNPFAGVSAGYGARKGFVRPRIGVEWHNLLRLSLSATFVRHDQNALSLSVGIVLGRKPKK